MKKRNTKRSKLRRAFQRLPPKAKQGEKKKAHMPWNKPTLRKTGLRGGEGKKKAWTESGEINAAPIGSLSCNSKEDHNDTVITRPKTTQ